MITLRSLLAPALVLSLCAAGCGSDGDDGGDKTSGSGSAPTKDDVVQVTDLLVAENDGPGALKLGDPSELLAAARKESTDSIGRIKSVLQRMADVAQNRDPDKTGTTPGGLPYGVWVGTKDNVDLKMFATRVTPERVRYLLLGKKAGDAGAYKGLLTGIFVKKAPGKGGGRVHLNLTNISDLGGGQADGSVHVWWSNFRDGVVARRLIYRNVVDRQGNYTEVRNYGMDYIRRVGQGGRFRTLAVGDLIDKNDGPEALRLRAIWKSDEGGRADATLVALKPFKVLGHVSECWDKGAKRTAYQNDVAIDDADNPNEGDVNSCWGFAKDQVPDNPALDATDADPEAEAELNEAGAIGIPEAEAEDPTSPE